MAKACHGAQKKPGDAVGEGEYGLGLFRRQYDGFTTVGHDGGLPGSGLVMRHIAELDVYIGAVTRSPARFD